jgi:hypothetical protein
VSCSLDELDASTSALDSKRYFNTYSQRLFFNNCQLSSDIFDASKTVHVSAFG